MEHFCLRWNNFHRNMSSGFRALLLEDTLVDVTLAADGRYVQAHRLVLSVCSPYFKELFSVNPCNHPIVVLKDVKYKQLTDILSFIYQGEVSVHQEDLPDFLKTAELLQIRGLSDHISGKDTPSISAEKASSTALPGRCSTSEVRHGGRGSRDKLQAFFREVTNSASQTCEGTSLAVSSSSSLSNVGGVLSEQGMILQVPIKQELPDVIDEFDHDKTMIESKEAHSREIQTSEGELNGPQVVLQQMNLDGLRQPQNRTWTESPPEEGASTSRKLVKEIKAITNNSMFLVTKRKQGRKQRMIALNKIRRCLVTPKRSRRIAHRMKQRKRVIEKSVLSTDIVSDISKSFPAIVKDAPSVKIEINCKEELVKDLMISENETSEIPLPISNPLTDKKNNIHVDYLEAKVTPTKKVLKRICKRNWSGVSRRKRVVRSDKQKTTFLNSDKIINENTETSEANTIIHVSRETRSGHETNASSVSINERAAMNKKKMIMMLAAKKTKSAVALARKTKLDAILLEKANSPKALPVPTDLSSKIIHSGKSTKQGSVERSVPSYHIRSNTHNGSVKELIINVPNGETCQHSGCIGCREDN